MRRLLLLVLVAAVWAPAARAWTWPVHGPVVQRFSFDRGHPYAAGQHRGIEIGADDGTPVLAPASGTVSFAGTVPGSGRSVTIATADGLAVTLTHLGTVAVARGEAVEEGATVGTAGSEGGAQAGSGYVHLGIRSVDDANGYLDPLAYLPGEPPAPPSEPPSQPPAADTSPAAQPALPATTPPRPVAQPPAPVAAPSPAQPVAQPAPVQVVVTPVRVVEVGSPASTRRGARSPGTPKVQRPAPRLATTPVEQTSAHVSSPPASQVPAAPAASVPVSRTRSAHRPPSRSRDVRTTAAAPPAVRRAEPRWSRPAATLSEPGTSRGSGLTLTALGGGLASLLGGVALLAVLLRHRTRPPAPGGGVVVPLRPLGAIREERCGRRAA